MITRPYVPAGTKSTIEYVWECDALGACVTVDRTLTPSGSTQTYVSLWLLVPDDNPALLRGDTLAYRRWPTTEGDLRWWVVLGFPPIDEPYEWLDEADEADSDVATVTELVEEARTYVTQFAKTLLAA